MDHAADRLVGHHLLADSCRERYRDLQIRSRELAAQGLYLSTNPSSAFFYVFTALHALHLLGGVAALGYVMGRLHASVAGLPAAALEAASLYWHFMGVLWLYLLLVLALRL